METYKDHITMTPDMNEERLNTLRELFPDWFTQEGYLDVNEVKKAVNPDSVEKTIDEMESRWYDRSHTLTEAEKMVEDYNNGNTILNDDCLAFVDTGQSFGM